MPQLHALLVGINKYDPRSQVRALKGCHNDVKAIQKVLKNNYPHLNPRIKILKDKQATREKLIQNFRKHLSAKAQSGDMVLFYFSGHGSYWESSPVFRHLDSTGNDETLVCYDSRIPGKYDLADKELAVLLSEVKEGIDVVVLIDSCHSGQMTKSLSNEVNGLRSRFTSAQEGYRDIKTYLLSADNYYTRQLAEQNTVQIPKRAHVVLGACGRKEEAWETDDERGVFTKYLVECLEETPAISYQDLFLNVRVKVKQEASKQNSQFQAYDNFNHNFSFLTRKKASEIRRHLLQFVNGWWRINVGAVHGLPYDPAVVEDIQLAVYHGLGSEVICHVPLEAVSLKESLLSFPEGDIDGYYMAEIVNFPFSLPVYLKGSKRARQQFRKLYQESPSPYLQFVDQPEQCKYELAIERKRLVLYQRESQTLLHGREGTNGLAIDYMVGILERVEEWERLAALNHDKTSFKKKDIDLFFYRETDEGEIDEQTGRKDPLITLEATEEEPVVWYQIKGFNYTDQELYFCLVDLDTNYSVKNVFPCAKVMGKSEVLLEYGKGMGFDVDDSQSEEISKVFKLIVSTEPFDDYLFFEEGFKLGWIEPTKGNTRRTFSRRRKAEKDWCTRTITLRLLRGARAIGAEEVVLEAEKISIKPHSRFRAKLGFTEINPRSRSVHALGNLPDIFRDEETQILDWDNDQTRSLGGNRSIIEITDLKQVASLQKEPLELIIDQELQAEEYLLPVSMDGDFVFTFGESEKDADGKTHLKFRELPVSSDPSRRQAKSIPRAFWFAVLKFTGFRSQVFRLRYVTYNKKGRVKLTDRGIKTKVAGASKILVLIHGIIGSTKPMAKNLRFLLDEKHYDLILTFDYENLNEPLEKTAKEFSKALKAVGLNARDQKQLDIVAHSMGGLVSRQMIEQVRNGDRLVDRLIMFGTPNGGSAFGTLPEYRDMLTQLMTVALNFGKGWLGPAYAYLEGVNTALKSTQALTVTLGQMSTTSDFITDLYAENEPEVDPYTKYYTVASNINDYKSSKDKRLARFIEKMELRVGRLVYGDEPNDIAVSVPMIHHVPTPYEAEQHNIIGHHLNYFEEGEGLDKLKDLLLGEG